MRIIKQKYPITITFIVLSASMFGFFLNSLAALYIARVLSKTDYGRMTYFANLFPPMLLILGFGLSAKVIKEVAEFHASGRSAELSQRLYTLLGLRLITLAPLPLVGGMGWLLTEQIPYLLVALAAMCAVLSDFMLGILRGSGKLITSAAILILQPTVYLALLGVGLAHDVNGVFLALGISYGSNLLVESIALLLSGSLPHLQYFSFSKIYARRAMGVSSKIYIIGLCQTAFGSWILILFGFLGWYDIVAELSVPLSLVSLLALVNGPVLMTLVYPRVLQLKPSAVNTFDIACRMVIAVALAVAAVMAVYSDIVIRVLYSTRYVDTAPLLVIQSPLVLILALESLMTLTQIGLEQLSTALKMQIGRLALLGIGSMAVLIVPRTNVSIEVWLSWVYVLAALAGLWLQARHLGATIGVSLRPARMVLSGTGAVMIAVAIRIVGTPPNPLWLDVLKAVVSGLAGLGLVLSIYFRHDLRSIILHSSLALHPVVDSPSTGKETTP
jgi:O-antigen/teichoic acid export membrane protein